jgi:4-hydroxyproline epimerase
VLQHWVESQARREPKTQFVDSRHGDAERWDSKSDPGGTDGGFRADTDGPIVGDMSTSRPQQPGAIAARDWLASQADWIRRSVLSEPRGCESMVGAYVCEPVDDDADAAVVFFNNTGYLGMCGHGIIGVVEAMAWAGYLEPDTYLFETPVGNVSVTLDPDRSVSFTNVASFRYATDVAVQVNLEDSLQSFASDTLGLPADGWVSGDIAYGGNWFYLIHVDQIDARSIKQLLDYCDHVKQALQSEGICGEDGAEIDHVELTTSMGEPVHGAKTFVLCPGGHYDRSPCGTGTSAKMACLAASNLWSPGQVWTQQSVIGSEFECSFRYADEQPTDLTNSRGERVNVTIKGRAHVCAETTCVFDPDDPFSLGIPAPMPSSASDDRASSNTGVQPC